MTLKLLYLTVSLSALNLAHEGAVVMNARTDWAALGNALALVVISALTTWTAWKAKKTAKTVDEVHVLVNSAMTVQKKMLAEVTASKAAITKSPSDKADAEKARKDWLAHESEQAKVSAKQI